MALAGNAMSCRAWACHGVLCGHALGPHQPQPWPCPGGWCAAIVVSVHGSSAPLTAHLLEECLHSSKSLAIKQVTMLPNPEVRLRPIKAL